MFKILKFKNVQKCFYNLNKKLSKDFPLTEIIKPKEKGIKFENPEIPKPIRFFYLTISAIPILFLTGYEYINELENIFFFEMRYISLILSLLCGIQIGYKIQKELYHSLYINFIPLIFGFLSLSFPPFYSISLMSIAFVILNGIESRLSTKGDIPKYYYKLSLLHTLFIIFSMWTSYMIFSKIIKNKNMVQK